jgi:hypothetical protein
MSRDRAKRDGKLVTTRYGAALPGRANVRWALQKRAGQWNRRPAEALNPKVKEFMHFMRYSLSCEGQQEIASHTTMLPLTAAEIRVQLAKLD